MKPSFKIHNQNDSGTMNSKDNAVMLLTRHVGSVFRCSCSIDPGGHKIESSNADSVLQKYYHL